MTIIASTETFTLTLNDGAIVAPYKLEFHFAEDFYGTSSFRRLPEALAYAAVVLDAYQRGHHETEYVPAYESDEFSTVAKMFFRGCQIKN